MYYSIRSTVKKSVKPVLLLTLALYFSYHIFQGRHGLLALNKLSEELEVRKEYLVDVSSTHERLSHKVNLMGTKICQDLLEEKSKEVLGVAKDREIVVILN